MARKPSKPNIAKIAIEVAAVAAPIIIDAVRRYFDDRGAAKPKTTASKKPSSAKRSEKS